ncbi:hypothetical protein Tco_0801546 [Tanacetum coccineum]|uniref:Uncharacterized protein n=1 Tax=Tanacetum coccineum TaxID=301880 RepID=A0ABQ5A0K6_9ASTR
MDLHHTLWLLMLQLKKKSSRMWETQQEEGDYVITAEGKGMFVKQCKEPKRAKDTTVLQRKMAAHGSKGKGVTLMLKLKANPAN